MRAGSRGEGWRRGGCGDRRDETGDTRREIWERRYGTGVTIELRGAVSQSSMVLAQDYTGDRGREQTGGDQREEAVGGNTRMR